MENASARGDLRGFAFRSRVLSLLASLATRNGDVARKLIKIIIIIIIIITIFIQGAHDHPTKSDIQ